jgi:hypothetical protein
MTGLDMEVIHLISNDNMASWEQVSTEHVSTPTNGWTCEPEEAGKDGTIYRGVVNTFLSTTCRRPATGSVPPTVQKAGVSRKSSSTRKNGVRYPSECDSCATAASW